MFSNVYLSDRVKLYHGDCLDFLKGFADQAIAAVITDPPYGLGENQKRVLSRGRYHGRANVLTDYGAFDWDNEPASPEAIAHIRRIAKTQVIFGGNYFTLPPTSCWFVWDKQQTGDFADAELAWTNLKSAVRIFRHQWNGFLRETERDKRVHPAQKPVALMRWILEQLNLPAGSTILDPYMGSGSVGIAAIQMGYQYIGMEKDPEYFKTARARLEDAERAEQGLPKVLKYEDDLSMMPLFADQGE